MFVYLQVNENLASNVDKNSVKFSTVINNKTDLVSKSAFFSPEFLKSSQFSTNLLNLLISEFFVNSK